MKLLVVCCLVAGTLGQIPQLCNSPAQWEGKETRVDRSKDYMENRRLYYDETNKRERKVAEIVVGNTTNVYDTLSLHNELYDNIYRLRPCDPGPHKKEQGIEYIVDRRTGKCNVTVLTRPFHYRGVIPGSTFQYLFEIGAAGVPYEHTLVQVFSGNSPTEHHVSHVTYPSCIPIQNQHFIGPNDYEESNYYDIKIGIPDPMAFVRPSECDV